MLAFVVPLKSRRVAKSWDYVSQLFERTLRSICNQMSPAFKVFVICHEKPQIDFQHPAVSYLSVDFPVPGFSDHPALNLDKYRKLIVGFRAARESGATHVIEVDADDCVSNRLAAVVARETGRAGWYFDSGYIYREGSGRIYRKGRHFYEWCGTSNIVRVDLLELPEILERGQGSRLLGHSRLRQRFTDRMTPLVALPFPGAVYVRIERGEANHHRGMIPLMLRHQPSWILHQAEQCVLELFGSTHLTPRIAAEFGLYPINAG
ncbi:MAG TPA: glycosyltransferase family 2 protein [Candidatus Binatia bacterium]